MNSLLSDFSSSVNQHDALISEQHFKGFFFSFAFSHKFPPKCILEEE